MFEIVVPANLPQPIRKVLANMVKSCQSEAKAMAEVVCDALADWDDDPAEMVEAMADEFINWGRVLKAAADGTSQARPSNRNKRGD